jgi:hypothetical protein
MTKKISMKGTLDVILIHQLNFCFIVVDNIIDIWVTNELESQHDVLHWILRSAAGASSPLTNTTAGSWGVSISPLFPRIKQSLQTKNLLKVLHKL